MTIKILTGFDGSCPHWPEAIEQRQKNVFVLRPGYRKLPGLSEEEPGKGSRLSVRIMNTARKTVAVNLMVDWETTDRTLHHDLGFMRYEKANEWTMIPGFRHKALVKYLLKIRPGVTHLGLYPEYNYSQCEKFIAGLKQSGIEVCCLGQSREKRNIRLIRIPSANPKAVNFFIQARDHAYETAGNYCVEGIVAFLRSGDPLAIYLRSKFNAHLVPMTNPDGVFNGMSRLTWEQGANMNRVHTVPDPAHAALKQAIDSIRPGVHMNIHNWTSKFEDGLLSNEKEIAERIHALMPDDSTHYKHWTVETREDWLKAHNFSAVPEEHQSWKDYCKDQFGAISVAFEFPWFGLNPAAMRAKGVRAFTSLGLAAIAERRW